MGGSPAVVVANRRKGLTETEAIQSRAEGTGEMQIRARMPL